MQPVAIARAGARSRVAVRTAPTPTTAFESQRQNRVIVGAAYWFPHQGSVSSALLVDYDGQHFDNITTAPVRSVAVHALVSF